MNSWTSRKNSGVVSASVSSGTQQKKWKKPHLQENHQENGVVRDLENARLKMYSSSIRPETIAKYAKKRKKFHV